VFLNGSTTEIVTICIDSIVHPVQYCASVALHYSTAYNWGYNKMSWFSNLFGETLAPIGTLHCVAQAFGVAFALRNKKPWAEVRIAFKEDGHHCWVEMLHESQWKAVYQRSITDIYIGDAATNGYKMHHVLTLEEFFEQQIKVHKPS